LQIWIILDDCGECRALTDESGLIESQHFPNEYSGNLSCLFTIKAPIGKNVQLKFTEFNVNQCCDFITVSLIKKCYIILQPIIKIRPHPFVYCDAAGLRRISQSTPGGPERLRNSRRSDLSVQSADSQVLFK
jgi:hypothetical protein